MSWIRSFFHKLSGHRWLYGDHKGAQNQPTTRVCKACGRIENYVGEMLWNYKSYSWKHKSCWKTKKESDLIAKKNQEEEELFNRLKNKAK